MQRVQATFNQSCWRIFFWVSLKPPEPTCICVVCTAVLRITRSRRFSSVLRGRCALLSLETNGCAMCSPALRGYCESAPLSLLRRHPPVNVTLLDYGAGNVPSVQRALQRLGIASERASTPEQIASASVLILPGVGHYAALIRALDENALRQPLLDKIHSGAPFLGICLGLQALFAASDEAPELSGLQIFPGRVMSLPRTAKLPHMGWNTLHRAGESRLLEGISEKDYFYFALSY